MIDKIRLHIPLREGEGEDLISRLAGWRRRDINTGTGTIGTMRVYRNPDGITIHGSLPKYLHGENMTPISRAKVREAVEKLETETGLDLREAAVGSVETGTSIILRERPGEYLRLFGDPPVYGKNVYSKGGFLETVSYGTPFGAYQICIYDKVREMEAGRQDIPELFAGKNVMRLEYRIIRRRGIRARFGRDLTAHDLYNYEVYRKLQGLFFEAYKAIPKMGRTVYIDKSKKCTPARLELLMLEQFRQSHLDQYNANLQTLKSTGALTEKNLERIRARDRRRDRDFSLSDKNPLIEELDAHVRNAAMYGA